MTDQHPIPMRRAELLDDLVTQTIAFLVGDFDLPSDLAEHVGHALADHLADHWSGQNLYFPQDHAYRLCLRELEILEQHDQGVSAATLARKYRMTNRGLAKLLKRAEMRQPDRRQTTLSFEK